MPFLPLRLAPLVLAATVALSGPATASVLVTVNKATQRMTVLVDGETRYSWPVSTGMKGYATPAGTFRPFRLEEEHYSKEWDDAPMPHSIFFTPAGHAIHGSNATRRLNVQRHLISRSTLRQFRADAMTSWNVATAS